MKRKSTGPGAKCKRGKKLARANIRTSSRVGRGGRREAEARIDEAGREDGQGRARGRVRGRVRGRTARGWFRRETGGQPKFGNFKTSSLRTAKIWRPTKFRLDDIFPADDQNSRTSQDFDLTTFWHEMRNEITACSC